jgi:hypothetical protein
LQSALKSGSHEAFFLLWDEAIMPKVSDSQLHERQELEFYLNIYFAIFPIHPHAHATLVKVVGLYDSMWMDDHS